MMKITQFDKRTLRMITDDIDKALAPLGVKYGLVFTYKGCRFNDKAATFKVEGGHHIRRRRNQFTRPYGFH